MPTRLLDVGSASDHGILNVGNVRLVQGEHCKGPYAALSYCWGPDRDLILTHDSHAELLAGIDVQTFPGTLRDAIIVTRQIGVQFLWIDALCIFQDQDRPESKADWAREAGRMRDVYRGAYVTIEAASASRGREGFLKPRASSKPYCALQWGSDLTKCVYLRPVVDINDNQLIGTTVYTRGWTLQERLLAPRTLSFGLQQCSFECAHGFVDEAGHSDDLPRGSEFYLSKRSMLQLRQDRGWLTLVWRALSRRFGLPAVVSLWDAYNIGWSSYGELSIPGGQWATYFDYWRGLVTQFSRRQLTNHADRLPALSGLADEIQRATGSVYVAGMWNDELVRSLAWSVGPLYNTSDITQWSVEELSAIPAGSHAPLEDWTGNKSLSRYVAPSWSWASVQGEIRFLEGSFQAPRRSIIEEIARVTHVQVSPRYTTDPLGGVESGQLTMTTLCLPIPSPLEPCPPKHHFEHNHTEIRRKDVRTLKIKEFHQHHKGYEGQTFAVIQLLSSSSKPGLKLLYVLLVESCEEGGYRRLCCLSLWTDTYEELEKVFVGDWGPVLDSDVMQRNDIQLELEKAAEMSREVREAPWERRTITLV